VEFSRNLSNPHNCKLEVITFRRRGIDDESGFTYAENGKLCYLSGFKIEGLAYFWIIQGYPEGLYVWRFLYYFLDRSQDGKEGI